MKKKDFSFNHYKEAIALRKQGWTAKEIAKKFKINTLENVYKLLSFTPKYFTCLTCQKTFPKFTMQKYCNNCTPGMPRPSFRACDKCGEKKHFKHGQAKFCKKCSRELEQIRIQAYADKIRKPAIRKCLHCDQEHHFEKGTEKYCPTCILNIWGKESWRREGREYVRGLVRFRDDNTCQICKTKWQEPERRFDIHHKEDNQGSKKYDGPDQMDKLITLCHGCHLKLHHGQFPKLKSRFFI